MIRIARILEGKKTYISAIAIGAVAVAHSLGYVDDHTYQVLIGLLGAGGLAALRAGVDKIY